MSKIKLSSVIKAFAAAKASAGYVAETYRASADAAEQIVGEICSDRVAKTSVSVINSCAKAAKAAGKRVEAARKTMYAAA